MMASLTFRSDTWTRFMNGMGAAARTASFGLKRRARPILRHIQDHGYTIAGFGCISVASFEFSGIIGLYVTGVLLLVFEWKVSELWRNGKERRPSCTSRTSFTRMASARCTEPRASAHAWIWGRYGR